MMKRIVSSGNSIWSPADSVLLDLPRNQVLECDVHLLFFRVALQLDDLHAVAQRIGHGIEHVRRRDEQHLRQIERHVQIVVAEAEVLLGIERLQQRRGRIAAEIASHLVDFVEHKHRIVGFRAANALHNLARAGRRCRCGDVRGSRPHRARRPATGARTCGPARGQSICPATSCPRPEVRRSTGSAPSYWASAGGPKGSPECGPSPSPGRSDRSRGSPSPSECPLRRRTTSATAAPPATRCSCASARNRQPWATCAPAGQVPSAPPSSHPRAFPPLRSSGASLRRREWFHPARPVPSGWPSSARAGSIRAGSAAPGPALRSGSCCAVAELPAPSPGAG